MDVFGNQEGWLSGGRGGHRGKLTEQKSSAFCAILGRLRYILDWQLGEASELFTFLFQWWLETKGLIWLMILEFLVYDLLGHAGTIQQCEHWGDAHLTAARKQRKAEWEETRSQESLQRPPLMTQLPLGPTSWRFHFLNRSLTHKLSETFKI